MKILVLTSRFPYPPIKGDKLKVYQLIKHFSQRHTIYLYSFIETEKELDFIPHLKKYCYKIEVVKQPTWKSILNCFLGFFSKLPFQTLYFSSREMEQKIKKLVLSENFDIVYVHLIRMGPYGLLFKLQPSAYKILALEDALSTSYEQILKFEKGLKWIVYFLEYLRVKNYEPFIAKFYNKSLLVSKKEIEQFLDKKLFAKSDLELTPHGVDLDYFYPTKAFSNNSKTNSETLIFFGNLGYYPNYDAVLYFYNTSFQLIKQKQPNVKLYLVGAKPHRKIRRLAKKDASVFVTGYVDDIRPYLKQAKVAICPLRISAGVQNKILEAMASGVPVVATSVSNSGIGAKPDEEILLADTEEEFANKVCLLLKDNILREKIALAGRKFVEEKFDWAKNLTAFESSLIEWVSHFKQSLK